MALHSSCIANRLDSAPSSPRMLMSMHPLRNPIHTWDQEYNWHRAFEPQPEAQVLMPVAAGGNLAVKYVPRSVLHLGPQHIGHSSGECPAYPTHERRSQGPPDAIMTPQPPFTYRAPRPAWGKGRPVSAQFTPAFGASQSLAVAASNAASGVRGKAGINNASNTNLSGAATARARFSGSSREQALFAGIADSTGGSGSLSARAHSHTLTPLATAAAAASPLYSAGYPQRLRGVPVTGNGAGHPPIKAISYHTRGRHFGKAETWITTSMEAALSTHGANALK